MVRATETAGGGAAEHESNASGTVCLCIFCVCTPYLVENCKAVRLLALATIWQRDETLFRIKNTGTREMFAVHLFDNQKWNTEQYQFVSGRIPFESVR